MLYVVSTGVVIDINCCGRVGGVTLFSVRRCYTLCQLVLLYMLTAVGEKAVSKKKAAICVQNNN